MRKLLLTCEHGGNEIPEIYKPLFKRGNVALNSHRGYDLGALDLFNALKPLAAFNLSNQYSRLLIELNRSIHHRNLFSEFSSPLTQSEKDKLIKNPYLIYRNRVEQWISNELTKGNTVVHISVHTFTPIFNGVERNADISFLYDPSKEKEKKFCENAKRILKELDPQFKVRMNYPYKGVSDGFTKFLRGKFKSHYLGIELEVNQKFAMDNKMPSSIKAKIKGCIQESFNS